MDIDDPLIPEFASWKSYAGFAFLVRHRRRFVWTKRVLAFLETVRATIRERDAELNKGHIFYRAQLGIDWQARADEEGNDLGEDPVGFGPARMKPRQNQALQGRANPAGISFLYLATTANTAISEVRPWVGSSVSVSQFELLRPLKAINLTIGHGKSALTEIALPRMFDDKPIGREEKEQAVWIDIDNAFSTPITAADDLADYVPTQILAELFRDVGYDAIIYKSQFGKAGFNIVLFNPDDADAINGAPYEVTGLTLDSREAGNRWFKR